MQPVVYSQAVQEINAGQVKKVTIVANKATIELLNSTDKQQLTLPDRPETFQKLLDDYNVANPSRQIIIDYQAESATFSVIGSIFLSLLPVVLIGGFFFYMMRQAQGTNNHALSFGKSRPRMIIGHKPTVTFEDVPAGQHTPQALTQRLERRTYPE